MNGQKIDFYVFLNKEINTFFHAKPSTGPTSL